MAKSKKRDDAMIRAVAKEMINVADGKCRPDQAAMAALAACIGLAYAAGIPRDVFMNTVAELFDQAAGN